MDYNIKKVLISRFITKKIYLYIESRYNMYYNIKVTDKLVEIDVYKYKLLLTRGLVNALAR